MRFTVQSTVIASEEQLQGERLSLCHWAHASGFRRASLDPVLTLTYFTGTAPIRWRWLVPFVVVMAICSGCKKRTQQSLDAIEKMGGHVVVDRSDPDRRLSVSLRGVRVRGRDLSHLPPLGNVRVLNIQGIREADEGMEYLQELPALQEIYLGLSSVSDSGLKSLAKLKSLRVLELAGTQVSDSGMEELKSMISLRKLNLSSAKISDKGLVPLQELCNLEELDLRGTTVSSGGVQALKKALPGLVISQ